MTSLPSSQISALTDPQIMTLTLFGEARGEPIEGQIAVACLIRNRKESGRFGGSYAKVCLAPWQFSCWRKEGGAENHELVMAMAAELIESLQVPENLLLRQCAWVSMGVIGGWIKDTTREATHYYAPSAMKPAGKVPKWAIERTPVVSIGNHLFFKGIK